MVRHQRLLHKARQAAEDAVQEEANPHNDHMNKPPDQQHGRTRLPTIGKDT